MVEHFENFPFLKHGISRYTPTPGSAGALVEQAIPGLGKHNTARAATHSKILYITSRCRYGLGQPESPYQVSFVFIHVMKK